ncbi:MAG: lysozyme inhibitor LprI family protein [Sutterellaceae bacterium]|nr:lysozyme inhibitor LprI family protein [Sutterellaceae bacterium]
MKRLALVCVLWASLVSATATANDEIEACWDTAMTTYDMLECSEKEWNAVKTRYDVIVARAMKYATSSDDEYYKTLSEALRKANRDFEAYANSECDVQGAIYSGGSIVPLAVGSCYITLYRQRAEALEADFSKRADEP